MPMPDGSFRPEAYEHDKTGWFWFGEPLPTYAEALGLKGTPGIVVGRQLVAGIADLAMLKKLVANSRRDHE